MRHRNTLLFTFLLVVVGLYASPLRAQSVSPGPFFDAEQFLGYDSTAHEVYYLPYLRTFTYDPGNATYVFKYNFGWLCYLGGTTPTSPDAYFYDCTSGDYFWTSSSSYPYFYSFHFDTYLYYYENSTPRVFYDFGLMEIVRY